MLKILISLLITLITALSYCDGAWREIAASKNLKEEQVHALAAIFSKAEAHNIPTEILESKLAEGLTKSVEFSKILKTLEQKMSSLLVAQKTINIATNKGIKINSSAYCLKVFSDLIEDGMSPSEIEEFINIAFGSGKKLDYALRSTEIYYGYSKYFPKNDLKQIFTVMLIRGIGVGKIEKLFQTALDAYRENIPSQTIKDLVMENIASNRSAQQLRKQIQIHANKRNPRGDITPTERLGADKGGDRRRR